MKKALIICVNLCNLWFLLTSCKQKPAVETSFAIPENAVSIDDQSAAQNAFSIEEQAIAQNASTSPKSAVAPDGSKIDFDLSEMNSDLVYASVFQMMIDPDTFANKVIRMRGNFVTYPSSSIAGEKTYAVIISDALACCKQGIEFHYDFAGKEPKDGDIVTVTGTYTCDILPGEIFYNYVKADSVQL